MDVVEAKHQMFQRGHIIDEDIPTFMMFASYIGSLKRIAYYKYVYKKEFDVRALADAAVIMYMFQGVYRFEFQAYINRKEVKTVLDNTPYPKWTKIGLLGGSTSEIVKLGEEFNEYMDVLENEPVFS